MPTDSENPRIRQPNQVRSIRGTAEFEALFAAFFLIGIILLSAAAWKIAVGRMVAGDQAQYLVWRDAYDTAQPQYANGPMSDTYLVPDPLNTGLPNRVYSLPDPGLPAGTPSDAVAVTYGTGYGAPTSLTLHETAMVPGPTWNISGTPDSNDKVAVTTWLNNYATSYLGPIQDGLCLEPFTPP